MVRTDIEKLVIAGKRLAGKTWEDVAEKIGTGAPNVVAAVQRPQFNHRFIDITEALGYDIEVRLVPRDKADDEKKKCIIGPVCW